MTAAALGALPITYSPRLRAEPPRAIVEVDPHAERQLDPRLLRRLVSLAMAELELEPLAHQRPPVLYLRVVGVRTGLRVELWERGEFHGARSVQLRASATPELRARRVALIAEELGQRYAERRAWRAAQQRRQQEALLAKQRALAASPPPPPLRLSGGVSAVGVGAGTLWLVGPRLALDGSVHGPFRVELSSAWLAGQSVPLDARARWWELAVAPGYLRPLSGAWALDLRASFAAAALRLEGLERLDALRAERDTWSARAAVRGELSWRLTGRAGLSFGPELGATLRGPRAERRGVEERVGGVWWGVGLALWQKL